MYKIYYANMAKGTGMSEIGKRPVVSVRSDGDYVEVYKITSRNRNDEHHVRMNNFLVHGYCDISHKYRINKKYLTSWIRDCTTSEVEGIKEGLFNKLQK